MIMNFPNRKFGLTLKEWFEYDFIFKITVYIVSGQISCSAQSQQNFSTLGSDCCSKVHAQ